MKGASQFESCHFTTHVTPHLTTDFIIHSNSIFFSGILMFCIGVIFDVRAHLGATSHFPILFATHQQVINKVMIEHTSNEILTVCTHVGYDMSTAADLRFHYSMAKCQYFIILFAFDSVVLRIATPA